MASYRPRSFWRRSSPGHAFCRGVLLWGVLGSGCLAVESQPPAPPSSQPSPTAQQPSYEKPVDYSGGTRVRLAGVSIGAGVGFGRGPGWYGGGPYGAGWGPGWYGPAAWNAMWWDPWFFSPFGPAWAMPASWVHPGYWSGFGQTPSSGEIELRTPNKDDAVMVDGAFAGLAKDLKRFWLQPGIYVIAVADNDGNSFERKVYVLSGKTLRLNAMLSPAAESSSPPDPKTR